MGGGHDGAAAELAARLRARGCEVCVVDFLHALPLGLGRLLRRAYAVQLRVAPWSYHLLYRAWWRLPVLRPPVVALFHWLAGGRLRRWLADRPPAAVVSTYTLSSLVLGELRRRGALGVPAVTVVTDFGVHPLWVHPKVDLHVCVHEVAAEAVRRLGGQALVAGPLAPARFRGGLPDRAAARAWLGLPDDARVVLVVAGSWGVGEVRGTVLTLARSGRFVPVTVCGRDRRLAAWLRRAGAGVVLGWVDDMPAVMAAADAVVENAGGLTCMEALAAGLPVVTYRPLPGHGLENAVAMAGAGVTRHPRGEAELLAALEVLTRPGPARARAVAAGRRLFATDAADMVPLADLAGDAAHDPACRGHVRRRVVAAAAAAAALYASMTVGVAMAAAHGFGVAHAAAAPGQPDRVFVAVRLRSGQLGDGHVLAALQRLHATAVLDETDLARHPDAVGALPAGMDVAFADWQAADVVRWRGGRRPAPSAAWHQLVPARRIDVVDLLFSRWTHTRVVLAQRVLADDAGPVRLQPGRVYLVDGTRQDPATLDRGLQALADAVQAAHLRSQPCVALR